MFELISYSNVFARYKRLLESVQKQQFFKPLSDKFIVVIFNICKETYILLEFYSE